MSEHSAHPHTATTPCDFKAAGQRSDSRCRRGLARKKEAGYVMVIAALSFVLLFGFVGLAIDVGQMRVAQRNLQSAADAAAIAGAAEILYPDITTAAQAASAANGYTSGADPCAAANPNTHCPISVTVTHPPADGPHSGNTNYVEVVVAQSQTPMFLKALGSVPLSARAVAAAGSPNCIYALQQGANSLSLGVSVVQSSCGVVGDGNIESSGFFGFGGGIQAPSIEVVGSNNCPGCRPTPTTGILPVRDPFASLPAPTFTIPPPCLPYSGSATNPTIPGGYYTAMTITPAMGTVNFSGGLYVFCGGLTLQGANVIFGPGTYVMYGGGFQMSGTFAGSVSGTGMMIYNTGTPTTGTCPPNCAYGSVQTWFTGGNYMQAPTTEPYAGILFFQDRNNPQPASFDANFSFQTCNPGNTNPYLQGVYYFPDATVNFDFDFGCGAQYSILVANDISWLFDFTFNHDYHTLPGGTSPIKNTGVLSE